MYVVVMHGLPFISRSPGVPQSSAALLQTIVEHSDDCRPWYFGRRIGAGSRDDGVVTVMVAVIASVTVAANAAAIAAKIAAAIAARLSLRLSSRLSPWLSPLLPL